MLVKYCARLSSKAEECLGLARSSHKSSQNYSINKIINKIKSSQVLYIDKIKYLSLSLSLSLSLM